MGLEKMGEVLAGALEWKGPRQGQQPEQGLAGVRGCGGEQATCRAGDGLGFIHPLRFIGSCHPELGWSLSSGLCPNRAWEHTDARKGSHTPWAKSGHCDG